MKDHTEDRNSLESLYRTSVRVFPIKNDRSVDRFCSASPCSPCLSTAYRY
jgi:hypothetical protein